MMNEDGWINAEVSLELRSPGDVVEGTYLAVRENMRSEFPQKLYDMISENGEEFTVFGSQGIDKQMANVPQGALVRIAYKEDVPTKSGGKFKVMKVQYKLSDGSLTKTKAEVKREAKTATEPVPPPPDDLPF